MKNKTCMICKLGIEIDKEQFVEVKHYEKKDIVLSKGYYHIKCFRDKLSGNNMLKKLQEEALGFIRGAKKVAGIEEDKKEYLLA